VAGAKVDKPVDGHPAFSDAAVAAVKQWRFEPARLDGKPVDITVKIPVKFTLQEK
jgi:protein TonB